MSLQNTIISFWEVYILIVKNYAHISKEVHRVRKWPNPLLRRKRDWIFHHVVAKPQVVKNKFPMSHEWLATSDKWGILPIPFTPWWRIDIPILHLKFSILHTWGIEFQSPTRGELIELISIPHCWASYRIASAMGNWISYVNSPKCLESSF